MYGGNWRCGDITGRKNMRDKVYRRNEIQKAKRRAYQVLREWDFKPEDIDARRIGVVASTHGKPCSCPGCGNPRRYFKELTIQERKENEDLKFR